VTQPVQRSEKLAVARATPPRTRVMCCSPFPVPSSAAGSPAQLLALVPTSRLARREESRSLPTKAVPRGPRPRVASHLLLPQVIRLYSMRPRLARPRLQSPRCYSCSWRAPPVRLPRSTLARLR
jgi:hypothetical protein